MIVDYMKTGLNKYTFSNRKIFEWTMKHSRGLILNLFAGKTLLILTEIRNDADENMPADYHLDALEFVKTWNKDKFDTVILDPPYSYRKSMEFYNGNKASKFNQVKDNLPGILNENGIVITFGYHSVSMGQKRNFTQERILLMSHGGAIHDTIAVVERKTNGNTET